jgi:hypothetical protein
MLAVAPDSLGVQRIDLARLPAGRWQAQIQWRAQGRDYYVERTVVAR